jgi:hypothetical protein
MAAALYVVGRVGSKAVRARRERQAALFRRLLVPKVSVPT